MPPKTKAQLEKEIKELKCIIRELRSEVKTEDAELSDMDSKAIGVFLDDDKIYNLAEISFSSTKKSAMITDVKKVSRNKMDTSSALRKAIIDELIKVSKGGR